jgi:hypothetical protein
MPIPATEVELIEVFKSLDAPSPEAWAKSQMAEGIPQLLRFLFLKGAWKSIPTEGDSRWIDRNIKQASANPEAPYSGLGRVLASCRAKGISDADLTELARCLKAEMLFSVGYLVDGLEWPAENLEDVSWGLFQVGEDGRPFGPKISGLHESVLELDPTGREMRPQSDS